MQHFGTRQRPECHAFEIHWTAVLNTRTVAAVSKYNFKIKIEGHLYPLISPTCFVVG
jgi:hypothetical protein